MTKENLQEAVGLDESRWRLATTEEKEAARARLLELRSFLDARRSTSLDMYDVEFVILSSDPVGDQVQPDQLHCVFYFPATRLSFLSDTKLWGRGGWWTLAGELEELTKRP